MADVFEDLKRKVRIEEVAAQLGYKVNPRAGTHGSYLEMQLFAGDQKADTIVIRKGANGNTDTYFHRASGSGGSVIDFVRENLAALGCDKGGGWKDVFGAFSRFTSLPAGSFDLDSAVRRWRQEKVPVGFRSDRFIIEPLSANPDAARMIYCQRAFSDETIMTFAPWISLLRDKESTFRHPCLAFPYREPGSDDVVGYELRGYGTFKGMAAGTNASTAAWIVDMDPTGFHETVRNVYFAESAYDIMAFWQHNRLSLDPGTSVFVSVGGQLSARQVTGLLACYPKATAVDCFDNDVAGRLYGIRTAALAACVAFNAVRCDDCVRFTVNGKPFSLPLDEVSTENFARHAGVVLSRRYRRQSAPVGFKDWNDVIMGRSATPDVTVSKYRLYDNLRLARQSAPRR